MANWITDAGHEIGAAEWQLISGASRDLDAAEAHEGDYSLYVDVRQSGFGLEANYMGWFGQEITLPDTTDRTLSFYVKDDILDAQNKLYLTVKLIAGHVGIDPYPGVLAVWSTTIMTNDNADWTQISTGLLSITGTEYTLVVIGGTLASGPFYPVTRATFRFDTWLFQSAAEAEDVAKRRDIKDAVVTALAGITTANGHAVQIGNVTGDYRRSGKITNWPEIQVVYGDESRVENELHRKKGQLLLHLLTWTKGDDDYTAEEQADEILASAEEILETQSNAQFIGLSYVDDVIVEDIEVMRIDSDQLADAVLYVITVRVIYRYDRTDT